MLRQLIVVLMLMFMCVLTAPCLAVPPVILGRDTRNTIPGTIAYGILADGNGLDWASAALVVDLTAGSVYNSGLQQGRPQAAYWPIFPELEWDTWFGVPGDSTNVIPGGAGDIGGGPLSLGDPMAQNDLSVSWFNMTKSNTDLTRIANVTLSDDAQGTWTMLVNFGPPNEHVYLQGTVADLKALPNLPPPLPEPASVVVLGLGLVGVASRSRSV